MVSLPNNFTDPVISPAHVPAPCFDLISCTSFLHEIGQIILLCFFILLTIDMIEDLDRGRIPFFMKTLHCKKCGKRNALAHKIICRKKPSLDDVQKKEFDLTESLYDETKCKVCIQHWERKLVYLFLEVFER